MVPEIKEVRSNRFYTLVLTSSHFEIHGQCVGLSGAGALA